MKNITVTSLITTGIADGDLAWPSLWDNPGSVKIGDQKIPIDVPRVFDNKNLPYQDEQIIGSVLHGLSTRDYGALINHLEDSFGLSSSTISRSFIEQSKEALEEFESRKLTKEEFIAILWTANF